MTREDVLKEISAAKVEGRRTSLSRVDLSGANLSRADLSRASLSRADLSRANLSGANLYRADLSRAGLSGADLSRANLSRANLSGANLSRARGLSRDEDFLAHLERDEKGFVVYKALGGTWYKMPEEWKIKAGEIIEEVCNPTKTCNCGCGVNFGTREYVEINHPPTRATQIWRCRIRYEWGGIVIPYNTDGKARCEKLELLERVA